jgi:hypothetical protein
MGTSNYDTYLTFKRESLLSSNFIEKAVATIHGMKMNVISPQDLQIAQQGQEHIFLEFMRNMIELVDKSGSLAWRYSQMRRLRFTSRITDPIKHAAWADVPNSVKDACNIEWSVNFNN